MSVATVPVQQATIRQYAKDPTQRTGHTHTLPETNRRELAGFDVVTDTPF
jgi:hypothetical protein